MTPELILTAEDIFGSPKPCDTDLIDISVMTDTKIGRNARTNSPICHCMRTLWKLVSVNLLSVLHMYCSVRNPHYRHSVCPSPSCPG